MSGGLPNPLSTKDLRALTGRDLRISRCLAQMTQGQLAHYARVSVPTIKDYECTERRLPEWLVDSIGDALDWGRRAEGELQCRKVHVITVTGLLDWQFEQKLKGLGKYVKE